MRILIVSLELWSENNNGGNVLSNIFSDFNAEFAQIYCSPGEPNNKLCKQYFQITDSMIINGIFKRKNIGKKIIYRDFPYKSEQNVVSDFETKKWYFKIFKKYRLSLFSTVREILWWIAPWKCKELEKFVSDFKPDVIFAPCYGHMFMLRLDRYVKHIAKANMISYISDDSYSLRQYSLSFFYWLNRLLTRFSIKKTFQDYSLVYTMTDEQATELSNALGANMKILQKGGDFIGDCKKLTVNKPLRLVYAGGIYVNRWKILAKIGDILRRINIDETKIQLDIYTQNEVTGKQRTLLDDGKNIFLHPAISQVELVDVYKLSDIALHVESFELKYRLLTRLSFSTKIVDCLASTCAVMAISWKEHAGLKYLKKNDAAICIDDLSKLEEELKKIVDCPEVLIEYANKAWECGKQNHQIRRIRQKLFDDFNELVKK